MGEFVAGVDGDDARARRAQRWQLNAAQFATHLGLPTLVGIIVAWPILARVLPNRSCRRSHPRLRDPLSQGSATPPMTLVPT